MTALEVEQFTFHVVGDQRQVVIGGELDIATIALFESATDELRHVTGDITVDLAGLRFIDSAGLNAFVSLGVAQHLAGRALRLVGLSASIRRTFQLGGLGQMFT